VLSITQVIILPRFPKGKAIADITIFADVSNTDENGVIFDIKKYAIHDGLRIRTMLSFKGCPLIVGGVTT
jgi:hypothetical protein